MSRDISDNVFFARMLQVLLKSRHVSPQDALDMVTKARDATDNMFFARMLQVLLKSRRVSPQDALDMVTKARFRALAHASSTKECDYGNLNTPPTKEQYSSSINSKDLNDFILKVETMLNELYDLQREALGGFVGNVQDFQCRWGIVKARLRAVQEQMEKYNSDSLYQNNTRWKSLHAMFLNEVKLYTIGGVYK